MPRLVRPVGYEDRLAVVDHLDELRSRLIVCAVALVAAFALCYIFNQQLLNLLNSPLPAPSNTQANHLGGLTRDQVKLARDLRGASGITVQLARSGTLSASDRVLFAALAQKFQAASTDLPRSNPKTLPITIGVGEPFTTTLTVCFYFALLLTLPVLLYQAYAFVIPALSPNEKRAVLPVMIAAPVLFLTGVVFTFVVVMPPAVKFLQGYNSSNFQALVQAKPLYSFEVLTMAAIGLAFQMPLGLLGLQRAGIINGTTLTRHWRYATVIIAVIAAAMPGADPVTTALETAPLVVLFLASIVMLRIVDRRDAKRALKDLTVIGDDDGETTVAVRDGEEV
ncbi:MAG TPA: twin-arginine translocase subunit TatC [Solirubrobacteraceae bacterium]|nr:twin-arginine translocase subunit TatC [Solirubrobacteraceae bacterium]